MYFRLLEMTMLFIFLNAFLSYCRYWVGVELAKPVGKNDGSVQGEAYFQCAQNHGLFTRPVHVTMKSSSSAPENAGTFDVKTDINDSSAFARDVTVADEEGGVKAGAELAAINMMKLKIANTMGLLNRQLEIIEGFESSLSLLKNEEAVDSKHAPTRRMSKQLVGEIVDIVKQEQSEGDRFLGLLQPLLSSSSGDVIASMANKK